MLLFDIIVFMIINDWMNIIIIIVKVKEIKYLIKCFMFYFLVEFIKCFFIFLLINYNIMSNIIIISVFNGLVNMVKIFFFIIFRIVIEINLEIINIKK